MRIMNVFSRGKAEKPEKQEKPEKPTSEPTYDYDYVEEAPEVPDMRLRMTWKDRILLNRPLRYFVVMGLAIMTFCLLFVYVYQEEEKSNVQESCRILSDYRVPCFETSATEEECYNAGCCYVNSECFHALPSLHGVKSVTRIKNEKEQDTARNQAFGEGLALMEKWNWAPDGVETLPALYFTARCIGSRLLLELRNETEAAPPIAGGDDCYNLTLFGDPFSFTVSPFGVNRSVAVSSSYGPMLPTTERWEATLRLPVNATVLGLVTAPAGTSDAWLYVAPGRPAALTTVLAVGANETGESDAAVAVRVSAGGPLRLRLKGDGGANMLHIRALSPRPSRLQFEIVLGSSPAEALEELAKIDAEATGGRLLPAWALGLHVCPFTYAPEPEEDSDSEEEVEEDGEQLCKNFLEFVIRAEGTPWDSHCGAQHLLWAGGSFDCLAGNWDKLNDRYIVPALPPAVRPNTTDDIEAPLVLYANGSLYEEGVYRNRQGVAYVDWSNEARAAAWAERRLRAALGDEGAAYLGGVVLRDNWPEDAAVQLYDSEASDGEKELTSLWRGTLWGNLTHYEGTAHYALHNALVLKQVVGAASAATAVATTGAAFNEEETPLIMSSAGVPGVGAAAAFTENIAYEEVPLTWQGLRAAVADALALGAAGAPLAAGAPICGNTGTYDVNNNTQNQVCARWYQAAATLPFMWLSSPEPARHPAVMSEGTKDSVKKAMQLRYTLLPYLRGLAVEASRAGAPLARYMGYEFPDDPNARPLRQSQWMLGPAVLVAPAISDDVDTRVYLPTVKGGIWRYLYGGDPAVSDDEEDDEDEDEDEDEEDDGDAADSDSDSDEDEEEEEEEETGHWEKLTFDDSQPLLLLKPGTLMVQASVSTANRIAEALNAPWMLTASVVCPEDDGDEDGEENEKELSCHAEGQVWLGATFATLTVDSSGSEQKIDILWDGGEDDAATSCRPLTRVSVYGVPAVTSAKVIGVELGGHPQGGYAFLAENNRVIVSGLNVNMCGDDNTKLTITWEDDEETAESGGRVKRLLL